MQYDDDPLVDPFSIYLQVFLSQALEPNFLTVIKETNGSFTYMWLLKLSMVIVSFLEYPMHSDVIVDYRRERNITVRKDETA